MTPAARVQAAIEILDEIVDGKPAEKTLTNWARGHRFAGSGDRAAIRDIVFDAIRRRRSYGFLGNGSDGRALMIGRVRHSGEDIDAVFSGIGHAPAPLSEVERVIVPNLKEAERGIRLDVPDWLLPNLDRALSDETDAVMGLQRDRAPVFIRANTAKTSRDALQSGLEADGFAVNAHPLAETALEVTSNARKLVRSELFEAGAFEMQDAASQAIVERLKPLAADAEVLDYCAGGGGKALALAALGAKRVVAHDAHAARMSDIPARAARAGTKIEVTERPVGTYDLVFCDAPCSGSGAWRRQPDAKWRFTPEALTELVELQSEILRTAKVFVRPGGCLAYATCSLLNEENDDRVQAFVHEHPNWSLADQLKLTPLDGADGFFLACLRAPD